MAGEGQDELSGKFFGIFKVANVCQHGTTATLLWWNNHFATRCCQNFRCSPIRATENHAVDATCNQPNSHLSLVFRSESLGQFPPSP
jgi:hypothetical protein